MAALLRAGGLATTDLAAMFLAGAFGANVAPADLETLGFLPPGLSPRVRVAGNLSLEGASLFLVAPEARRQVLELPERTAIVPLATGDDASDAFIRRMEFAYVP